MVRPEEIDASVEVLKTFGARKVILFGSALTDPENAYDLDLACEGIAPQSYFSAVAALLDRLGRDVDLIDLTHGPNWTPCIYRDGKVVYERC